MTAKLRPTVGSAVVASLLATAVSGSAAAPLSEPLVFAHRGDKSVAPENTIAAIEAAMAWADGVEMDLWLAPDGTFRLSHGEPAVYRDLPTLDAAYAAAGDLLLDLDLKSTDLQAHLQLGAWIADREAERVTVNVKSLTGARAIREQAPGVTIEAQPAWVDGALTAREVDIVLVWGDNWRDVLEWRGPDEVAVFVSSIHEMGTDRFSQAQAMGVARYLADSPP